MKKLFTLIVAVIFTATIHAQEKCSAASMQAHALQHSPTLQVRQQAIEAFTRQWAAAHPSSSHSRNIITIPVVVHVVHEGEAVGTGSNISDAQIAAQITAANLDFKNLNADSLPSTHAFYPVVGNAQIEFCMASRTPAGAATTGIDRINAQTTFSRTNWQSGTEIDTVLKPATIWDPTKYLNLWTVSFFSSGPDSTTLGYATFPENHGSNHDGVVFRNSVFGLGGNTSAPNDKGRTFTHEIGHYLNLFHIWGDANCGNDSVADTPPQVTKNFNCPTFPLRANNACGAGANGEMFMNYMDYVDDGCMNMFTKDQVTRMIAALNGPRQSLLNSLGCQAPNGINDIATNLSLKVYPTPATGWVQVTIGNPVQSPTIEVYDMAGQKVYSQTMTGQVAEISLNLNMLSSGVYSLVLSTTQEKAIAKIILTK